MEKEVKTDKVATPPKVTATEGMGVTENYKALESKILDVRKNVVEDMTSRLEEFKKELKADTQKLDLSGDKIYKVMLKRALDSNFVAEINKKIRITNDRSDG